MIRSLHVYCGPFPTPQGTQTLIGQTCSLLAGAGHEVHLLCYSHGETREDLPYRIHRIPDFPRFQSERSGIAWQKAPLDLAVARECRKLRKALAPDLVHAHHLEALFAARAADLRGEVPLLFHLHSMMGPELQHYVPGGAAPVANVVGAVVDSLGPGLGNRILAVSDDVAKMAIANGASPDRITVAHPPALVPPRPTGASGHPTSRDSSLTVNYTGNLDRYQGLDQLLEALQRLRAQVADKLKIEIVTASDPTDLKDTLVQQGLAERVEIIPHGSFDDAWRRLCASDMAIVPRSSPGGIPIKAVNAMAAGVPLIADRRVCSEFRHGTDAWLVDASSPAELAGGLSTMQKNRALRGRLSIGGPAAVSRLFDPAKYVETIEGAYREMIG